MDELDHEKVIKKIIYKELEPSVLNEKIITKTILDQGPGGEAGRLFRSVEIQYDKITVLRLEFLNILKIDHVWILPNLQILSLAFNKIDKIENLEQLGRLKELNLTYNSIEKLENLEGLLSLEVLSVFGNKITMIENVDCLENLITFCAGNNLIDTKEGIERLRFLKKLRTLSLKGNAVESDKFFRIYIAGLLPQLTYYQNKYISKVERDEGKDRFRFKLREIMDAEKVEVQERERLAREREENVHFSECFIEHLDQDQLFDSLFVFDNEEQGECLLNIGGEEKTLKTEFHDQSFEITQKIFKVGLEQFEKRSAELKTFINCVTVGKKKVQVQGQRTIDDFNKKRDEIFAKVKEATEVIQITEEELQQKISDLSSEFNELHDKTWKKLMENEMHLNESVIDLTTVFEHVIQDQMNDFMEQCKSQFVQLREVENNFVDALVEAAQSFVTMLASSGREDDIPEQLRASLIDRDVMNDYASGMREMHMQKIDGREDVLVGRGKTWVQELCDQMMSNEVERNRRKVMEINFFLDNQQIDFDNQTTDVRANVVDSSFLISDAKTPLKDEAVEEIVQETLKAENNIEPQPETDETLESSMQPFEELN